MKYFSRNGRVLPVEQATVPLSDVHYSYGFGVYETIRATHGKPGFLDAHCERLLESARIINLAHNFTADMVDRAIRELIEKNQVETCNVKVLLLGGVNAEAASLNILCLNPLFPDRKLYRHGAPTITAHAERPFPHAKTLNMLPSYLANRQAKAAGAYEALLVNHHGCITEGTGTNFFALKGRIIYSPPEDDILLGVTRDNVLKVAKRKGFEIKERDFKLTDLKYYDRYDNLFLTSTSTKIMPISSVDDHEWGAPSPALRELMDAFNEFLDSVIR